MPVQPRTVTRLAVVEDHEIVAPWSAPLRFPAESNLVVIVQVLYH
jgi:hypothetical protein